MYYYEEEHLYKNIPWLETNDENERGTAATNNPANEEEFRDATS